MAPEHRRAGVAERLLVEALRRMRRAGTALTILYAFRLSFYRRFGYGLCEVAEHLRVPPAHLPASPLRRHVRPLRLDRDGAVVRALYEAARAGTSGPLRRGEYWWEQRVLRRVTDGVIYEDPAARRPTGYLLAEVEAGTRSFPPLYPVRELVAATPEAHRGLVGHLEALRDQYPAVDLVVPRGQAAALVQDFGLHGAPEDLPSHPLGYVDARAMARVVDVAATFAAHPAPAKSGARGQLGLDLTDPVFSDQTGPFDVTLGARGARAVKGRAARDRLALSIERLSQVVLGAVRATALLDLGHAAGSRRAAALLDAAFAGPALFLGPANLF